MDEEPYDKKKKCKKTWNFDGPASGGFTVEPPPSFFRLEPPEIFLLRKTLTKKFRPDNPPSFFQKIGQGGLSTVNPWFLATKI
jgi:hypothetical protein